MYRILLNDIWLSKIYKTRHDIIKTYKILVKNQDKNVIHWNQVKNENQTEYHIYLVRKMNFCGY